ncbi:MAG: hypothetical protein ACPG4Z_02980 [Chitinophagales bacterium]
MNRFDNLKIKFIPFFFIVFYISCDHNEKENSFSEEFFIDDSVILIDSNFVSIAKLKENYSFTIDTCKNKHSQEIIDSIYTFYTKNDTISIYKAYTKEIICNINNKTPELPFLKNVGIGSTRKDFISKMDMSSVADTIIIENVEGTFICTFIFNNDVVQNITYKNQYLD